MVRVLVLFLVSGMAWGADFTYIPPTAYTDGSPLNPADISGYEFRCGAGTSAGVSCPPVTLPGSATGGSIAVSGPASGFTACIEGATRTAVLGPYSTPACKTFAAVPPNPPSNVVIAVVIGFDISPVYKIGSTGNRSTAVAGLVRVGSPCSGDPVFTYRGVSWRRVDPANVGWWKTTPTPNVAGPCS